MNCTTCHRPRSDHRRGQWCRSPMFGRFSMYQPDPDHAIVCTGLGYRVIERGADVVCFESSDFDDCVQAILDVVADR